MSVSSSDYFHGLWRASANEGVPYSEDFPEPLLVVPELIDGALGDGKASIINIHMDISNPEECILKVADNGEGIKSVKRMKDWTSKDTGNAKNEHEYGHGSKKCLTKWMPDYKTAKWDLYWRTQDKRGVSSVLNCLSSPFKGLETTHIEDDVNEDICPIRGTQWDIKFKLSILGKYSDKVQTPNQVKSIMESLRELICVRYEYSYYHDYTINLSITDGKTILKEKSSDWKTLKQCLEDEIQKGNVKKLYDFKITEDKTNVNCSKYKIIPDGRTFNLPNFPTFGRKNMKASRVHIGRNGRYIEPMPYSKFIGSVVHNDDNGTIMFIMYTGDELPTPCTTKVKLQEECPIYIKMTNAIKNHIKKEEDEAEQERKQKIAADILKRQYEKEKEKETERIRIEEENKRKKEKEAEDQKQKEIARKKKEAADKIIREKAETEAKAEEAKAKVKAAEEFKRQEEDARKRKEINDRYELANAHNILKTLFDNYGRELLIKKLNEML